jgi:heme/copper-type cytochrome/quinol oxidase subunit 2
MLKLCSPTIALVSITVIVLVFLALVLQRQRKAHKENPSEFDQGTWLLIGLFSLSLLSFGAFIIYTFLLLGGC